MAISPRDPGPEISKSPGPESPESPRSKEASSPPASTVPGTGPTPLSTEEQQAAGILPASHWAQQPVGEEEDHEDDGASTISSFISSTASLSESIFDYRTIHGRTYHGEIGTAQSWEPNDQRHLETLELAHHAYTITMDGKLFHAPLDKKKVQKVVDIGTGTGIWAIDFADDFPNAEVIGTDITPIQPSWVPANVKFELDDCNAEWTWADDTFDFIYIRMMLGIVADWDLLFRQAYRTCKPGGYVENFVVTNHIYCDDGTLTEDSAMAQWGRVWKQAGMKMGRPFTVFEDELDKKGIEAAGFVDIEVKEYYIPLGVWHKDKKLAEKGLWWKVTMESDLEGFLNYAFNAVMGWTPEETTRYAVHLKKEFNNPKLHGYSKVRCVWGRKPE